MTHPDQVTPRLTVLVVDDDRLGRHATAQQLSLAGYGVVELPSAAEALTRLEVGDVDVVLTDLRMPGMDGLALLRELRSRFPDVDVMLMSAYGSVESAVSAMQLGATDYLSKPFRFPELDLRLKRLAESRAAQRRLARLVTLVDEPGELGLIGRSAATQHVRERIRVFAAHNAPVLITGETGTGKELVARALHDFGPRRSGRFVAVPCGAVPANLAESYFFGHERGAFTGANTLSRGVFEQADGGTILLDDVDDLPADVQVKLLRVLQEGVVCRVGGSQELRVDVRVVATTKINLSQELAARRFRSDLYYRLRGLEIATPPLRERGDDVVLLADHFLRVLASALGRPPAVLSASALNCLRSYDWPGNVRELRRTIESADALAQGGEIERAHLPAGCGRTSAPPRPFSLNLDGRSPVQLGALVRQFEDELIAWAMAEAGGQQSRAAELLGVPRTTLQSKLARNGQAG